MKSRSLLLGLLVAAAACRAAFNPAAFGTTDALYDAAMAEYAAGRWDNATRALDRLVTELSPRDPRMPVAYLHLAQAQEKRGDHLLAAKSYSRIYEIVPEDTLADDALLASGIAYQRMWRKPALDAEHGENAVTQFQTLIGNYPTSPLIERANDRLAALDEWFAIKDYETGYHYLKRKAYDSAIIYFRDVIRLHPNARKTRDAYLRLHDAYNAISYREDARDLCITMRAAYPDDRAVREACGSSPSATASQ